jgi:ABC-type tungstate transport system permease subunit
MGITLQVAGERRAYVLSDIGTFLAYRQAHQARAPLEGHAPAAQRVLGAADLAQAVPEVQAEAAQRFEGVSLVDPDTQRRIGGVRPRPRYGAALFTCCSPKNTSGAIRVEARPRSDRGSRAQSC